MAEARLAGAILAGGRSTRMGGRLKALVNLAGRPLLQHVIDRLQPQVNQVYLSVERYSPALECFGLAQVEDPRSGSCGPLGGLMSALQAMPDGLEWLLLLPCDAPFLPLDLGARLHAAVLRDGTMLAMVDEAGQLQPTFSLWNRILLPSIEDAVMERGLGGFKQYLQDAPVSRVQWKLDDNDSNTTRSPFFNINSPDELLQAETVIKSDAALR